MIENKDDDDAIGDEMIMPSMPSSREMKQEEEVVIPQSREMKEVDATTRREEKLLLSDVRAISTACAQVRSSVKNIIEYYICNISQ